MGPAVTPAPLGEVRSAKSLGVPDTLPTRRKNSKSNPARKQTKVETNKPTIYAKFELRNGKPVSDKGTYRIWVAVQGVPEGTQRINYEILDDTFSEPEFSVDWGPKDFADWIKTYGDVFLSAKGKGKKGPWRTQTTLLDALKLEYGQRSKAVIQKCMQYIADN